MSKQFAALKRYIDERSAALAAHIVGRLWKHGVTNDVRISQQVER